MSISIYGAFRGNTTMSSDMATSGGVGSTFQISSYDKIAISDGADPSIISGDDVVNEVPNDPTQTLNGKMFTWDYTIAVTDGTNTYEIGVMDYDLNNDGQMQTPTWWGGGGEEQGYFLGFLNGNTPPLNTQLTIQAITDNGPSIDVATVVPCLVAGTMVATPDGARPVQDLGVGDLVLTADHGAQPIRWIGGRELNLRDLLLSPKLHPVRIKAGALGQGMPTRDLCVSPQHRMLVRSPVARRMFGGDEVLIAAKKLVGMPGIYVDDVSESVTYYHVLLDDHQVIFAEGAPTESLFTGPQALKGLGKAAYDEIVTLFPELAEPTYRPAMARLSPTKGAQINTLVRRHVDNDKPLVAHS
ncbi:Hint domain-containing protein [uncultured Aliiroseovarius sp.]|uniref:Hint domain-containing protein n=1 Tax=uncultured Aliiroseovarius sp. TaxID=1658783 RepID=UPI00259537C2|nr:Hint domain-containing protein [uncultured Aliiroseovarius sp.]